MAQQKIRTAKGVRLTAEQRAKLEDFRAKEAVLVERLERAEAAHELGIEKLRDAEEAYLTQQGLTWTTDDDYPWEDVVGRRGEESEED